MTTRCFMVLIRKDGDMYVAECPEVGTVDQGETVEAAIANLKEATRLYLEEFPVTDAASPLLFTTIDVTYEPPDT